MRTPLRALMVEDSEDDARLVTRALERGGYDVSSTRVDTAAAMQEALHNQEWDVVLCDYAMPHFSGPAALELLRAAALDIPFLTVSGKVGEEKAIEMMHAGASDYILKDNLLRLVPAVERELRDAGERRERRRAEQAAAVLTAERDALLERLQLQIARMPLAYLLFDPTLRLIDWNPAAEKLFGYSKAEALALMHPFDELVPPAAREETSALLRRLRSGDMQAHSVNENWTKGGRTLTCQWLNTPLIDAGGRFGGILSLAQDLTESKALKAQYRQAQKMEAMGQLAGGVAHDFNNLLTIINGYSGLVANGLDPGHACRGMVELIQNAGLRAAALTRQLLIFSRKERLVPGVLDPNGVIGALEKMLRRMIGEDVRVVTELGSTPARIKVDPGHLEQVLFNLVLNARDAMPRGGEIAIRTRRETFGENNAAPLADMLPGSYVTLEVQDTGSGMTPEIRAHIFEPFFTTKAPGKGTGLGLATVISIVKESAASIEVDTKPGVGTTFRIYFPEELAASTAVVAATAHADLPSGNEVVLLVEDEEDVRDLASTILVRCGYTVLQTMNGKQALAAARAHPAPIPIMITDVVMPEMGGYQAAEELRQLHPETQVLFTSGYPGGRAAARMGPLPGGYFLEKPFSPDELARKVREVLDSHADRPPITG